MKYHRRLISSEKLVNFLNIILSHDSQSTGIRLPVKFTEEYGKYLSERVRLKVPNGDVWKVGLHKSGDEIWLKNGWGQFAERYGIGFSNLLMFKYEGDSTFGVIICNASASEIEYPDQVTTSVKRAATKCLVSASDESVPDDDDSSSSWSGDQEHEIKIEDEGECSNKTQRVEGKQVTDFKCDKPFFMVYINESHLTNRGVSLPTEFRRKLLKGSKNRKCLLQLKNDGKLKAWNVVAQGGYLGNADWLMFVQDNGVKVGVICVFELINRDKNVGVTIYRSGS